MQRLTDEQRELAGQPEHVALALHIADRHAARCHSSNREDLRGAAMIGLCDAAAKFDPARGPTFAAYASVRIAGAVLDHMRAEAGMGMGSGRAMMTRGDRPTVKSLATVAACSDRGEAVTLAEVIPAGEMPVGWEIESADGVTVLSGRLPAQYGRVMRAYYLRAEAGTMASAGAEVCASESLVSLILKDASRMLREAARAI